MAWEEEGEEPADGSVNGGGYGPWGLGWMKGKRPKWRQHPPHDEEEEEEREEHGGGGIIDPAVEGGSQSGRSSSSGVPVDVNTATTDATSAVDVSDLGPIQETSDVSAEQRLGEAVLARAGDRCAVVIRGREGTGRCIASVCGGVLGNGEVAYSRQHNTESRTWHVASRLCRAR